MELFEQRKEETLQFFHFQMSVWLEGRVLWRKITSEPMKLVRQSPGKTVLSQRQTSLMGVRP